MVVNNDNNQSNEEIPFVISTGEEESIEMESEEENKDNLSLFIVLFFKLLFKFQSVNL